MASPPPAGPQPEPAALPVFDPLEPLNRTIFGFNEACYTVLLRPLAHGYQRVVPVLVRAGLRNFFNNLKFPVRFAGCVLQGKLARAGREAGRFLVNSTRGFAGVLRYSEKVPALAGLPAEDIGQALGGWGFRPGPYLVLPIFGPSSVRDSLGFAGEALLDPVGAPATQRTLHGYSMAWRHRVEALEFANSLPGRFRAYDTFRQSAAEPYAAVRSSYLAYRAAAVKE